MRVWSLFRKVIPVLVIAAMLSSFISVVPVAAADAAKLVFGQAPLNTVAGAVITPAVTVLVEDAGGNLVSSTASVTLAIGTNPSGGTLGGTVTMAASGGIATFNNLTIDKPGTGYILTAASTGLTGATSSTFNITIGAPEKLVFSTPPSNTTAGGTITAVVVTVEDHYNNTVVTSTAPIAMAITTNPTGGTLLGTTPVNAIAGIATFNDLSIAKAGNGYKLTASSAGVTSAVSATFNITVGIAAKLAITVQPTNTAQNTNITSAVTVAVQDAAGNTVTTSSAPITLAIGTDPSWGTLTGGGPVNAVNGVATFSNLQINNVHAGYTLIASSDTLITATTNAFTIFGTANKLAFTVQPPNVAAGATLLPAVVVTVQDAAGNTIANSAASVTIALGNNPGGATLGGTLSVTAANGVATFSNLTVNKPGTGYTLVATSSPLTAATSTPFDITIGTATKLAITAQPGNTAVGVAINPVITVTVQDVVGNTVTTYATPIVIAIGTNPGSGTLGGTLSVTPVNGVATFNDLTISSAGAGYTLTATSASLASATTTAFNVFGPAASLVITAQPTNTSVAASITPAVTVTARDAAGITVYNYVLPITMTIGTNPGTGVLSGTVTATAVHGVATFSGLTINTAGIGYTLVAGDGTLTSAASNAFNVFGPPAKLAFGVQPAASTAAGATIIPAVTVLVQDAAGITITSSTASVTIAIGTNPAAGTLSGTKTVNAINGVVTFNTLSIDKLGTGYTLTATGTSMTAATSSTFNIVSGAITATSISPNFGPVTGGTNVTIAGSGFVAGATVTVGGVAATNVIVASTSSITATVPASTTTGAKDVVVTIGTFTASLTGVNGFIYIPVWWAGDSYGAYGRRTLLTITNTTGSVLAPYEVKITVPHVAAMKSDYSDVRFIANDNTTLLSFWLNSTTTTASTAEFWVKIPSLPAGSFTIYMYYGNSAASSLSNIHNTFIFGDDFENPTITTAVTGITNTPVNLDPYVQADNVGSNGAGNPSQQIILDGTNHVLNLHGDNSPVGGVVTTEKNEPIVEAGQNNVLTTFAANSSYTVDLDVKTVGAIPAPVTYTNPNPPPASVSGSESAYICGRYTDVSNKYEQVLDFSNNSVDLNKVVLDFWTGLGNPPLGFTTVASTWYTLTGVIVRDSTGNTDDLQVYVNGIQKISTADNSLMTDTGLAFLAYNDNGLFNEDFDNFRVRHYAYAEPTTQIGAEQSLITVTTTSPATGITTVAATLNGSWTSLGTTPSLSYSFSYGPTVGYGSTATAQVSANTFNAAVSSLVPGTPYHFQAAINAGVCGVFYGADTTFTTLGGTTTTTTTTTTYNPPPSGGGGGGGGGGYGPSAPTTVAGVTTLTNAINAQGVFTLDVVAWSDDKLVAFVIGTTTKGVDSTGVPLTQISILGMTTVPTLPAGAYVVGLAYDFEQSGAVFTPTVPVRFSYNPALLPAGVAESSLQIAYFDTVRNVWVPLTTTMDTNNHFIFAQIAHFTTYAVTYGVPAPTPVPTTTTTPPPPVTTLPVITTALPTTTTTQPVATTTTPVTTTTTQPVPTTTQPTTAPAASFSVSGLVISPNEISTTETATVKVTVTNKGNLAGTSTAVLKIDNNIVGTKSLLLAAGESQDAVFTVSKDTAGTYSIDVNGQSGTLTVKEPAASTPFLFKHWWILAVIILVVAVGTIVMVTSRRKSSSGSKGSAK